MPVADHDVSFLFRQRRSLLGGGVDRRIHPWLSRQSAMALPCSRSQHRLITSVEIPYFAIREACTAVTSPSAVISASVWQIGMVIYSSSVAASAAWAVQPEDAIITSW
ncbi:unnamed protein product [Urochloa humidicola]